MITETPDAPPPEETPLESERLMLEFVGLIGEFDVDDASDAKLHAGAAVATASILAEGVVQLCKLREAIEARIPLLPQK